MFRDTSSLPEISDCIVLVDDDTLLVYVNGSKETYKLFSHTWKKTLTESSTPPNQATTVCYTLEEINLLPSPYDFITPIYHTLAIVSALFIFWVAYRLIIYPFYRIKL